MEGGERGKRKSGHGTASKKKRAKVTRHAGFHGRHPNSLAVKGAIMQPGQSLLVRAVKGPKKDMTGNGAVLLLTNVSTEPQTLWPSQRARARCPAVDNVDFESDPEYVGMADDLGDSIPITYRGSNASGAALWNKNIMAQVLVLPQKLLPGGPRALPEEVFRRITEPGSKHTIQYLVESVPALPGNKAEGNNRNFMGYDRTEIMVDTTVAFQRAGQALSGITAVPTQNTIVEHPLVVPEGHVAFSTTFLGRAFHVVVPAGQPVRYQRTGDALETFLDAIGTSGSVSLIQKIIRRRPEKVSHPDTGDVFASEEVMRRIILRMCGGKQAGLFLPVIGKFVPAIAHFLKRSFIIAAEDSFYDAGAMFRLSTLAILAYHTPYWLPSEALVHRIMDDIMALYHSEQCSYYELPPLTKAQIENALILRADVHSLPLTAICALGGMDGDKSMLWWLSVHPRNEVRSGQRPGVDSLAMYCDQHQEGNVVCLLPNPATGNPMYGPELSRAFYAFSGRNSRRQYDTSDPVYERHVLNAIQATDRWRRHGAPPIASPSNPHSGGAYSWRLDPSCLAGMVRPMKVTVKVPTGQTNSGKTKFKNQTLIVTVSGHDISKFVVIFNPSRGQQQTMSDITPDMYKQAVTKAREVLRTGVRATNVIDDVFKRKLVQLVPGDGGGDGPHGCVWRVGGIPWSDQLDLQITLRRPLRWNLLDIPRSEKWEWVSGDSTFGQGQIFDERTVQWCAGLLSGFDRTVCIPSISRIGAGKNEALVGTEALGFQYLMHLSSLFPDAIFPGKKAFTFHTRCIQLRRQLVARLRRRTFSSQGEQVHLLWESTFSSELTLKPPQRLALEQIKHADDRNLASFLWMLVGQGKTLTVLEFIRQRSRCPFVLWALPRSAIGSVREQISGVGWHVDIATSKTTAMRAHSGGKPVITLVEHDTLRKVQETFAPQMFRTLLVFDEVHKAMARSTQRTAAALRLAKLSKQMIALTGTPIVDSKGYGLMQWLRLCVLFPVTNSNFWTAANSMVTELNTGNVLVRSIVEEAPQTEEERQFFRSKFPRRAPWLGTNDNPSSDSWREARDRTMEVVDRDIVRRVVSMYNAHPSNWEEEHALAVDRTRDPANDPASLFTSLSQRPLIVAANQKHAVRLIDRLLNAQVRPADIIMVGGKRPLILSNEVSHASTIHLTESRVLSGEVPAYKIAVASISNCEGYSLTWLTCQITGVYPSNQAKRSQMAGRINRLDSQRLHKIYFTIVAGLTNITLKYQQEAANVEKALRSSK